jgi:rfaE bifunctional protein nucleotidyltransferase chain/domain
MTDIFAPVLEISELVQAVERERAAGNTIILTNGCFDLFHVGHARYLLGAKALGGLVVCAVNSDTQARRLKGAGRPVYPEHERAELVSALRCVDLVTIFHEPTVEELIRAIRPDIHAKGTDYRVDSVPEREIVLECGGHVAIVGDPKDHSSTDLFETVRQSHGGATRQ